MLIIVNIIVKILDLDSVIQCLYLINNLQDSLINLYYYYYLFMTIVSDNGSNFLSEEFEEVLAKNGIHHRRTAPYHPASNGLAERAVQTFKEGMKKMSTKDSLETQVSRFVFKYRITPQTTTRIAPAELLLGRKPRARLDLLHPDIKEKAQNEQRKQKELHDRHAEWVENSVPVTRCIRGSLENNRSGVKVLFVHRQGQSPTEYCWITIMKFTAIKIT